MYRALIVDDERAARETIQYMIDWDKVEFEEPLLANNGQRAWELYQNNPVDVVITDIEMPLMDGLELIQRIKKRNPEQRIVIISCHERFDYARSAFKMGVEDYFLKDLITPEELYAYFLNLKQSLEKQQFEMMEQKSDLDRNRILLKSIGGEPLEDPEKQELAGNLLLSAGEAATLLYIVVDGYGRLRSDYTESVWTQKLAQFREKLNTHSPASLEIGEGKYVCAVHFKNYNSILNGMNSAIGCANSFRALAEESGILSLSIGISAQTQDVSEFPRLFQQAERACSMRVILGLNKNIFGSVVINKIQTFDKASLNRAIEEIREQLRVRDARCVATVQSLYSANLIDGFMEVNYFHYLNTRLYGVAVGYLEHENLDEAKLNLHLDIRLVDQLETVEEMKQYFSQLFTRLLQKDPEPQENSIVGQAKQYIERNYQQDIGLNDVAEALHIHKGYLCRVFKAETGENLMQYIISRKIERAKEYLLTSERKLYEISDLLGFATPQYFSIVFKKQTGFAPNEFKKNATAFQQIL